MSKKDDPARIRNGRKLRQWAMNRGAVEYRGRHPGVIYGGRRIPIPDGELPVGTHRAILKSFKLVGLS